MPEFDLYTKDRAIEMLDTHRTIFAKPDEGSLSKGVVRLRLLEDGRIEKMSVEGKVKHIEKIDLPDWSQTRYFIQEAVPSCNFNGRSVEVRVYLQKMEKEWEVRALIPKISPNVTQFSSLSLVGGTTQDFSIVFADKTKDLQGELSYACLDMAEELNKHLPGIRELGFDMGIDIEHNPKFIEVNTEPNTAAVRLTKNLMLYNTIAQYKDILRKTPTQNMGF